MTRLLVLTIALTAALAACSDDDGGTVPPASDTGFERETGRRDDATLDSGTEDVSEDLGSEVGADAGDDSGTDADDDGSTDPDAETDTPDECDLDGDGALSRACGGDDCDDDNIRISPNVREVCDDIDQDCDGELNNGISCTFYAHTEDQLFEIDPFAARLIPITDAPSLFDFDTDSDGTLWGISPIALYRFDNDLRDWVSVASLAGFSVAPNGFAIDSRSNAYATAGNDLYGIDLEDGSWDRIGSMGGGFTSSGDCVVDKNDVLYMTSKHHSDRDTLVRIDTTTAAAVEIGDIVAADGQKFRGIYGLTSAWGYLFGLSSDGELIEIDPATGAGELIHTFEGQRWYGAASTAGR